MRQFDVCPNPSERSRAIAPYVVVLQSHLLAAIPTVIVAPMLRDDGRSAYSAVSVSLTFDRGGYIVSLPELAGVDAAHIRETVGNLGDHEDAIRRALDRLFTGF